MGQQPELFGAADQPGSAGGSAIGLRVTFESSQGFTRFEWTDGRSGAPVATGHVRCTGPNELTWELDVAGQRVMDRTSHHQNSIHAALQRWLARFPVTNAGLTVGLILPQRGSSRPRYVEEPAFGPDESPWPWLEQNIMAMATAMRFQFSPLGHRLRDLDPITLAELKREERRLLRQEAKRAEADRLRRDQIQRRDAERHRRQQRETRARASAAAKRISKAKTLQGASAPSAQKPERPPLPPVQVRIELPALAFQETAFPLADWRGYLLREHAALWWVSNQSDDLLALPHCHIQRLDYQIRTALRVLGPLRGRALLSDEVGLGKTIEAGLVLKELLTRGLVKRFLVLTVPSLVDQWEEELSDKFDLVTVTTNQAGARADPEKFWRESAGIIASLHTLKQPTQLDIARTVKWDLLIVDEAHYLRNRESQAWQAVNALPRQFLLLLTATPVQNSLEELYNLVTLLQPGQLPTPKEFRVRFINPKRPRQPREPEELRRLLGQVMIRNTRANAGVNLPARHAETVLFEPAEEERVFWQAWETEFRAALTKLPASQANLWGRLLLQAAGSSPAAWRQALAKFPDRAAARAWQERAVLETSWKKKCGLLQPLTHLEGGTVIFTQFLHTQSALAESLHAAGVETFVINGATPADQRHPITEDFRRRGGALLLTHSGTEGRNLQFCHRLVNFDLPWNPMEIEQRIGRLHRLGQQHPVRIYNLVQADTLQEHLLVILQEKLNLFELVVGETGLVLGERYSSDEFAEEILRRWRESEGRVAESLTRLGDELAAARNAYAEVKQLDETLFAQDYESL
jgi:SNF2 family DNA or RNA helicase